MKSAATTPKQLLHLAVAILLFVFSGHLTFGQDDVENPSDFDVKGEVDAEVEPVLFVPNAFTPNSDGHNDSFLPKGSGLTNYQLFVYSKYGIQVFETTDQNQGWNGRIKGQEAISDSYIWVIRYDDLNGKTIEERGSVLLIH